MVNDVQAVGLTNDERRARFRQLVGEALTTLGDAGTDRDQFDAIQLALISKFMDLESRLGSVEESLASTTTAVGLLSDRLRTDTQTAGQFSKLVVDTIRKFGGHLSHLTEAVRDGRGRPDDDDPFGIKHLRE